MPRDSLPRTSFDRACPIVGTLTICAGPLSSSDREIRFAIIGVNVSASIAGSLGLRAEADAQATLCDDPPGVRGLNPWWQRLAV